jgi:hypothetical protein
MLNRLVAVMLCIVLGACSVAPGRYDSVSNPMNAQVISDSSRSVPDPMAAQTSESTDSESRTAAPSGPARVIAVVLAIAIVAVAIAAAGKSAQRDFRQHCCQAR